LLHQQVVGVESGHDEDADPGIGQRAEQRGQDADEGEVERAGDSETTPALRAPDAFGDSLLAPPPDAPGDEAG
jgi:hypothetical protein